MALNSATAFNEAAQMDNSLNKVNVAADQQKMNKTVQVDPAQASVPIEQDSS